MATLEIAQRLEVNPEIWIIIPPRTPDTIYIMMKSYANEEQLLTFAKNIKNYMNCEEIVQPIENKESIELEDKEPLG